MSQRKPEFSVWHRDLLDERREDIMAYTMEKVGPSGLMVSLGPPLLS